MRSGVHVSGSAPWSDTTLSCDSCSFQGSASGHGSPWGPGCERFMDGPVLASSLGGSGVCTMGLHSWNIWWCVTKRMQDIGANSSRAAIIHATPWVRCDPCSSLPTLRRTIWCRKVVAHGLGQLCCSNMTGTTPSNKELGLDGPWPYSLRFFLFPTC